MTPARFRSHLGMPAGEPHRMHVGAVGRPALLICALALVLGAGALRAPDDAFAASVAPVTTDDVPATYRTSPIPVTLTATDADADVDRTYYTTGTSPPAPTTLSAAYDPRHKPTLANGERIRYFTVDDAGNAEADHTSRAAFVLPATNYYSRPTPLPTGDTPFSVAIGDLNGDGRPDLAVANYLASSVTVIARNSAGTGWDPPVTAGSTGSRPISVAIGDVNGDGKPDLATADNGGNSVTVITRNSAGTGWDAPATIGGAGPSPNSVAIGDLNGDGKPDLAVADNGGNSVTVITRDSAGTGWDAPATIGGAGPSPNSVAIGDLNGDGKPDLAVAGSDFSAGSVTVITRDVAGTGWDAPAHAGTTDIYAGSVVIGDLTGDGRPDLATANQGGSSVTVVARNAAGTGWDAPTTIDGVGSAPDSLAIGDLNGDGRPDLAASDYADGTVTVITRNATGTDWDAPTTAGTTNRTPRSVAIGDVDGDGRPDVVTADSGSDTVTVLGGRYDGGPPVTSDSVDTAWHAAPFPVTLTATDDDAGVAATYYTTGTVPATPTTASARYDPAAKPVLADGERISYFSVDALDKTETVRTSTPAKVDGTAADTQITGAPADPGSDPRPEVAFASTTTDATFECSVDDGTWTACTSPLRPPPLADGRHTVAVRAVSHAGVVDATAAVASFTIDTVAPSAPVLLGGPPPQGQATTVSIAFATDAGSSASCAVDGDAPAVCASPFTLARVAVGRHTVKIVQRDVAGNASAPLTVTFEVLAPQAPAPAPSPEPTGVAVVLGSAQDHDGRYPVIVRDGRASLGCRANHGVLASCSATAASIAPLKTRTGHLPPGTRLANGAGAPGIAASRALASTLTLTAKGRSVMAARPLGVTARLTVLARTPSGAALTGTVLVRLVSEDRLILPVTGHRVALSRTTKTMLARLVRTVTPAKSVRCTADTDVHDTASNDLALTRRQAAAACAYLRLRGIHATLTSSGHGHRDPRASNRTRAGRARNRRLTITTTF